MSDSNSLHTLIRNEFIHFVNVFFWMCKRSSCSVLIRSFSNLMMPSRWVMLAELRLEGVGVCSAE